MNNDDEQKRIDDIYSFLESETKALSRKNRIQGFKQHIIKSVRKIIKITKPERIFIHRTFKRVLWMVKVYQFKYNRFIYTYRIRRDMVSYLFIAMAVVLQIYHVIT